MFEPTIHTQQFDLQMNSYQLKYFSTQQMTQWSSNNLLAQIDLDWARKPTIYKLTNGALIIYTTRQIDNSCNILIIVSGK